MTEITPYWMYILLSEVRLFRIEKFISADARAPKEDISTRKAAHVPLLLWST